MNLTHTDAAPVAEARAASFVKRFSIDFWLCVLLWLFVAFFWQDLHRHAIRSVPVYLGELKPIDRADWLTMWTWTDYGTYFRYSPTALVGAGMIDRYMVAPYLGIKFPSDEFIHATRLIPVYIASFATLACLTYGLCRSLSLDRWSALVGGIFIGTNTGFAYYFIFASCIATILLIAYGVAVLYFGVRFLKARKRRDLILYYVALLLSVGAWEQWVNWLAFLVPASLLYVLVWKPANRSRVILHGAIVPALIGLSYVALRYPTARLESSKVGEAQYVLSYPSTALMVEDVAMNATAHLASIVQPLAVPWPLLSQSMLRNQNMDAVNPYNSVYTPYSAVHYRGFADWYAGLLSGLFVSLTAAVVWHLRRDRSRALAAGVGLGVTYAGFAAHLPIMYRSYFALPGYVSLLDYKHALSILGFAVFVGWGAAMLTARFADRRLRIAIALGACAWIAFCNYSIVTTSSHFAQGVFPW